MWNYFNVRARMSSLLNPEADDSTSHEFSIPGLLMNLLLQSLNSLCDGERKKINKKFIFRKKTISVVRVKLSDFLQ